MILKIIFDIDNIWIEERRKKIGDLLKAIEERLLSLETEKEELKQYQKWDRSKRGLECAICMAECDDAKKRIDEVKREKELL